MEALYALILVCNLSGDCAVLQDKLGPYERPEECQARLAELSTVLVTDPPPLAPPIRLVIPACDTLDSLRTTFEAMGIGIVPFAGESTPAPDQEDI